MILQLTDRGVKDLQTIVMFALRYACGRKTYAFNLVSEWIINHYNLMQRWQLRQMGEEIESDIALWGLSDWERDKYLDVASKLKDLADMEL